MSSGWAPARGPGQHLATSGLQGHSRGRLTRVPQGPTGVGSEGRVVTDTFKLIRPDGHPMGHFPS